LRPYQQTGVQWLRFLSQLGLGGCLADDMGLGKTLQVLALLLLRKAEGPAAGQRKPSLLVAPASLLANWRSEISRFAPSINTMIVHPSESTALELNSDQSYKLDGVDFVLTTYGMITRLDTLRRREWDLVILDEAQAIKNSDTRQTRAVKELKAATRFALTGTPVENRASDLWSIFDFINPGLLGSASEFSQYIRARDASAQPDYTAIRTLTKPYILRRLKSDKRVISDLPEKCIFRYNRGASTRWSAARRSTRLRSRSNPRLPRSGRRSARSAQAKSAPWWICSRENFQSVSWR
jgi:non-specific serine/threonine protein kinase